MDGDPNRGAVRLDLIVALGTGRDDRILCHRYCRAVEAVRQLALGHRVDEAIGIRRSRDDRGPEAGRADPVDVNRVGHRTQVHDVDTRDRTYFQSARLTLTSPGARNTLTH